MDFNQCFEILANRSKETQQQQQEEGHEQACPCCSQPRTSAINGSVNIKDQITQDPTIWKNEFELEWTIITSQLQLNEAEDVLANTSSFDLLQRVLLIQQFRIKVRLEYHL